MGAIRDAALVWVKAEWAFRGSAQCYTAHTQQALVEAEAQLRAAVTGEEDLGKAVESLGVCIDTDGAVAKALIARTKEILEAGPAVIKIDRPVIYDDETPPPPPPGFSKNSA